MLSRLLNDKHVSVAFIDITTGRASTEVAAREGTRAGKLLDKAAQAKYENGGLRCTFPGWACGGLRCTFPGWSTGTGPTRLTDVAVHLALQCTGRARSRARALDSYR